MTSLEKDEGVHTNKGFDSEDLGVDQGKISEVQSLPFDSF